MFVVVGFNGVLKEERKAEIFLSGIKADTTVWTLSRKAEMFS